MSALLLASCTLESARRLPSSAHDPHSPVRPPADFVVHCVGRESPRMHAACDTTSQRGHASRSSFDTLPVEVVNHVLSYLTHPRSRLPGLTEAQSSRDFCSLARSTIKKSEDLTAAADSDRWAANLFNNHQNQHPFHSLSLTSKRCNALVESYCGHLVRACNTFNLPFAHLDKYGPKSVWPDMSRIVYRRLWLQHAPRKCIYCYAVMDCYPFPVLKRLLTNCQACFYRQTLVCADLFHARIHLTHHTSPSMRLNASTTFRQILFFAPPPSEAHTTLSGSYELTWKHWPCSSTVLELFTMPTKNNSASHAQYAPSPHSRLITETPSTSRPKGLIAD
jgi:hypothetical protein